MDPALINLIRIIPDFPKPGIIFKDITPLLADPAAFQSCCKGFEKLAESVDYIAGIEARGFIFGAAVSAMSAKGFIPIRKSGKLPGATLSVSYNLEYGQASLEIHKDLIPRGSKVLVIDDVLATGGTACAAIDLVIMAGLQPTSIAFLLEIPSLGGKSRIASTHPQIQIHTLLAE
ncbi:MAG: adenine phosphoribosyltransferase [Actinobacteria bacterium]|nr:adenine phosphoribosyltransferase [Actinomycetota bacterium]